MNLMLYVSTVLIWGSTWIAIAWQLGPIPIEVSVLYRFALAALAPVRPAHGERQVSATALGGPALCCPARRVALSTNFLCFYHATLYIPSGLSAVIFASASIFNGLNLWLFEGKRPGLRWLQGSLLGLLGTLLLFWPVLADAQLGANGWKGLLFACAGTLCFSLGNLVSARGQRQGYHVLQMVPWGMVYGVALLLGWVTVLGQSLTLPTDPRYLAAMVYLAIFGSVIAFTAYLTLVGRIGASKAAYATVLFPLVALTLSTFYEGFVWQTVSIVGVVVSLIGNLVIFAPPSRRGAGRYQGPQTVLALMPPAPKVTASNTRGGRTHVTGRAGDTLPAGKRGHHGQGCKPPLYQSVGGQQAHRPAGAAPWQEAHRAGWPSYPPHSPGP